MAGLSSPSILHCCRLKSPDITPVDSQERKPRRVWLIILIGCVALVLLFAGWLLLERYRAKSALDKYEKELLAKGEKLTFDELVPPFPEGENAAPEFVRLSKALQPVPLNPPPGMKLVAPGKAMIIAKQQNWSFPNDKKIFRWEYVQADLEQNADTLAELRAFVRSPVLRSIINYRGHATLLPHLASSKSAAQWLSASVLYNLHSGNVNAAIDDIESITLILRLSADEPFVISQVVRIIIATIAVEHGWPVLQADNLSEAQLARLQKIFHDIDLITPMSQAFRRERVMGREAIRTLRTADISAFRTLGTSFFSPTSDDGDETSVIANVPYNDEIRDVIRTAIVLPMWRFVWSYEDERHLLEEVQALIAAIDEARAQRSAAPVETAAEAIRLRSTDSWSHWATGKLVAGGSPRRAFRFQAHNGLTITAIALKRYHLRHGKYPQTLDQLVPEFLKAHPVDWMDGQRLRYRLEGDSFVLWSVGENGTDDGGTPDQSAPYNFLNGPDMVWPRPASNAEVEAHNESTRPERGAAVPQPN